MKKLLVLFIPLILTLVLSACGNSQISAITRERALEIALEKAGVAKTDIRDLDIDLDNKFGGKVWEIDFDHKNLEYSYDVNAETGVITKVERERD